MKTHLPEMWIDLLFLLFFIYRKLNHNCFTGGSVCLAGSGAQPRKFVGGGLASPDSDGTVCINCAGLHMQPQKEAIQSSKKIHPLIEVAK